MIPLLEGVMMALEALTLPLTSFIERESMFIVKDGYFILIRSMKADSTVLHENLKQYYKHYQHFSFSYLHKWGKRIYKAYLLVHILFFIFFNIFIFFQERTASTNKTGTSCRSEPSRSRRSSVNSLSAPCSLSLVSTASTSRPAVESPQFR